MKMNLRTRQVLASEPQHELAHPIVYGRTPRRSLRPRPFATHELAVPAQQSLWSDDQSLAPPRWEQASERRKPGTISRRSIGRRCCGPSTASWCRKTSNSTSLANVLRRPLTNNHSRAEKAR
jgi:hypothetical protein